MPSLREGGALVGHWFGPPLRYPAFVGGTWLAVAAYLLARAMASIGILVLMAGVLNVVKRSKG